MRKPDVVCIGAQKAGTSWVHETLGSHHEVWVPPFKEVHFFDYKFIPMYRKWIRLHVMKGVASAKTTHLQRTTVPDLEYLEYLERIQAAPMFNGHWYQHVFSRADAGSLALDVTPEYCEIPSEGVDFVSRFLGSAKFIYVVRSPVSRALSQLKMNFSRKRRIPATDDEWIDMAKSPQVRSRNDYISNVENWDRVFSERQLLFLPFGLIASNPQHFISTIESFLDIPSGNYAHLHRVVHRTRQIDVPPSVVEFLESDLALQQRFLVSRFGLDFVRDT